ncbi:MAG: CCA tRNA nucleotidyltransferase, partial [Planctomycetes bacterium]|nr:CCA tRNA nucleotidyltransferase [Planctomycetota bacterium]
VQHAFRDRRTLAIGAEFGVIAVLGTRRMRIEVATFRQDGAYSDGRHPDAVTFSTAEHDAQRRDFTINGLFFDPLEDRVIDYVGGLEDLKRRVVRAIGDPRARFDEDKLRMLRAVRFTATYECRLDPDTLAAIQQQAGEIVIVSAERIAEEMRKMLPHPRRAVAAELLRQSRLLAVLLPESHESAPSDIEDLNDEPLARWRRTLEVLDALREPRFPVALAALVREIGDRDDPRDRLIEAIGSRWRLSNEETAYAAWIRRHESLIHDACEAPWPRLQRVLIDDRAEDLLALAEAVAKAEGGSAEAVEFCRRKLALPPEELNPPPLLTGDDLIRAGLRPGPQFRELLETARDAQLEGTLHTRDAALAFALGQSQPQSTKD